MIIKNLSAVHLIAIIAVIIPALQNLSMLFPMLTFLLAIVLATQIASSMALDEKTNWERMVSSMPLSKYTEVASKYILLAILGVVSFILVIFLGSIFAFLLPTLNVGWDERIIYAVVSFSLCLLYNAIMIPATYKFGSSKSRLILFVFVAVLPTVGIFFIKQLGIDLSSINLTRRSMFLFCFVGLSIIELVSYAFSVKIRKRKN